MQTELLIKVQEYAENILTNLPHEFTYHNLAHTKHVVEKTIEIGTASQLSEKALENVLIAAWLHDVGYQGGCIEHEERSKMMADTFLKGLDIPHKRIEKIIECIEATKMPQRPRNEKEMVLCDADLSHLAAIDFLERSEQLRIEVNSLIAKTSEKKWWKSTVDLMQNHQFFTPYAKENFEPLKQINLQKSIDKLNTIKEDKHEMEEIKEVTQLAKKEAKIIRKEAERAEKEKKPDRGIETMFRTTSANHLQLSAMADNKANIMISVNSIIISLVLGVLMRKLEDWPNLIIPTAILTLVCLLATIFAILAVRPQITSGKFSREDVEKKSANLLFFGNFHEMELSDYEWGMREMMNDSEFLYASLTRDIYYLGKVLGKKYEYLRISYTIFMFGFVSAVIAFVIAMIFFRN